MDKEYYEFHREGLRLKFAYSIVGLLLGLSCILGGLILVMHGAVGHTSWTASVLGLSSTLNDAGPGVVLFVVGLFLVLITRFRVRERKEQVVTSERRSVGSEWQDAVDREEQTTTTTKKGFITYGTGFLKPRPDSALDDWAKKEAELPRPREEDGQKR